MRLYQCDQAEYEQIPHTASRELSPRDRETLRKYSSELCLWTFGAAAKQARTAEMLAMRIRPVLQQQAMMQPLRAAKHNEED